MSRPVYHTRHIPVEHILPSTPMGRGVMANGLCDVLTDPTCRMAMKDYGIDIVETRLVWTELEPEPGRFAWDRLDRDMALMEEHGFGVGVFPWFQHPPAWEKEMTRLRCLEHSEESTIPSLWDPGLLRHYDRLYEALARRYGSRIRFLYVGVYGDYGEVLYPTGVKHYYFSPLHGHAGYWCSDTLARKDFAREMAERYGSLDSLNAAWGTAFTDWDDNLMPVLPLENNPLQRRIDFGQWYTGSLLRFTDEVCTLVRRHFPDTPLGLPMGAVSEALPLGQIKSAAAKIAARHHMTARWTGLAHLGNFGRSNVCSRRISSAARFYGAGFGTEAALKLTRDNAANAVYESLANGAGMLHNDPGNILRAEGIYERYQPAIRCLPIQCTIAIYYPLEGEQYRCLGGEQTAKRDITELDMQRNTLPPNPMDAFFDECQRLRGLCDYEIADSLMITDGFLGTMSDLIIPMRCPIPAETAAVIIDWMRNGSKLWLRRDQIPWILETGSSLLDFIDDTVVKRPEDEAVRENINIMKQWLAFEPYNALGRLFEGAYITIHKGQYSVLKPISGDIEIINWENKNEVEVVSSTYEGA